eukprot:1632611-Rhodomonas_salina.4
MVLCDVRYCRESSCLALCYVRCWQCVWRHAICCTDRGYGAMRYAVLTEGMALCEVRCWQCVWRYAICGTDRGHGAVPYFVLTSCMALCDVRRMCGPDLGCGAIPVVLASCMALLTQRRVWCYAMCGTDIGNHRVWRYAGTDQGNAATRGVGVQVRREGH